MAKVGDRHECGGTKKYNTFIRVAWEKGALPPKGEWRMVESYQSDDGDWLLFDCGRINYCPWCGIRLG